MLIGTGTDLYCQAMLRLDPYVFGPSGSASGSGRGMYGLRIRLRMEMTLVKSLHNTNFSSANGRQEFLKGKTWPDKNKKKAVQLDTVVSGDNFDLEFSADILSL